MPELVPLYADDYLLVFDKPAGLLSVPGRGPDKQDCLSSRAQAMFDDALIVHRLDQATSGLLLMARGAAMQRALSAAFASRQVHKRYLARVAGDARHVQGWQTIDLPIGLHWPDRPRRHIDQQSGQPSQTRWHCLAYDAASNSSLLELEPLTGRTHQLRVHLSAVGFPMYGDTLYASSEVAAASPRLLLHAHRLQLPHPVDARPMEWVAPCAFADR